MNVEELQNRLAENLRTLRKKKDWTQFELAEKADMAEATIKSIELKKNWPSKESLAQITTALDIDVYELFLPVAASFEQNKKINHAIKTEIANEIRTYVDNVLHELGRE